MWTYDKKLQYPVKIKNPNALYAKIIISQLGGPYCKKIYRLIPENKPVYSIVAKNRALEANTKFLQNLK